MANGNNSLKAAPIAIAQITKLWERFEALDGDMKKYLGIITEIIEFLDGDCSDLIYKELKVLENFINASRTGNDPFSTSECDFTEFYEHFNSAWFKEITKYKDDNCALYYEATKEHSILEYRGLNPAFSYEVKSLDTAINGTKDKNSVPVDPIIFECFIEHLEICVGEIAVTVNRLNRIARERGFNE